MSEKYCPSNGIEGAVFIEHFCGRCEHDKAFREETGDSCPIVAATFCYAVDDPKFPAEWVYVDGRPTCTAFTPEEKPGEYRCEKTPDMFAAPPRGEHD